MKPNKYQRETEKMAYYKSPGLWYYPLGLCGETGEILDVVQHQIFVHRSERDERL